MGTLPILQFTQDNSRFVGFDACGSVRLGGEAWATLGIGLVEATLAFTNAVLPHLSSLRGTLSLDLPYSQLTGSP